jgi:hypothetical protein
MDLKFLQKKERVTFTLKNLILVFLGISSIFLILNLILFYSKNRFQNCVDELGPEYIISEKITNKYDHWLTFIIGKKFFFFN